MRARPGRLAGCVLLWLATTLGVVPAVAQAPGDATAAFEAGESAFSAGDYAAALRAFERARDAGASSAAVHYNIGVSQYRLGEYAAAAETFRGIAARFPRMREVADYNLGLALTELGRVSGARTAFARALGGDDDKVARLAAAMLERLGPAPADAREPRSRVALVDVAAGHDDNVALVDELSVPSAAFLESPFLEAVGYVNAPFGDADRFGVEATGYWVDYRDASAYDQLALRLGFDYRPVDGARRVTVGPYYERSELGGTGFEQRFGVELEVATRVGERGALSFRFGAADVDALGARYAFAAGDQRRAEVRFRAPLASGVFTARYGWEDSDRAAASVAAVRDRVRLGWRRRLGARWEAGLELGYRDSRYDELATPRTEKRRRLAFDFARDVTSGWQLTGTLSFTDNSASDPVYAYEREVFSLGMRKVF